MFGQAQTQERQAPCAASTAAGDHLAHFEQNVAQPSQQERVHPRQVDQFGPACSRRNGELVGIGSTHSRRLRVEQPQKQLLHHVEEG